MSDSLAPHGAARRSTIAEQIKRFRSQPPTSRDERCVCRGAAWGARQRGERKSGRLLPFASATPPTSAHAARA